MELGKFLMLTVTSLIGWSALYGIVCSKHPHRSREWSSRIVTMVHALISLVMSSIFGFFFNPWPFTDPGGETNIYEITTMVVSNGYFIFEFLRGSLIASTHDIPMSIHHLICILFTSSSLLSAMSGTEICFSLFLAELTNPMLQLRWFMRSAGIRGGILYELNQVVFLVAFAFIRVGIGSYMIYTYLKHPLPYVFFKVGASLLYLVSLVFMGQIIVVVHRKISQRGRNGTARGLATTVKTNNDTSSQHLD